MFKANRTWMLITVLFLLWSGIASAATFYYRQEAEIWRKRYSEISESMLKIEVIIDYNNETIETYPEIYLFNGATVLDSIRAVAKVNATYWGKPFDSFLINSVNDVVNNAGNNNRWWVYSVNGVHGLESADKYKLSENDVVEWIYYQY